MRTETLQYYLNKGSLCPSDIEVDEAVSSAIWWNELKNNFDDIIWLYFADRYVFINNRYSSDDDITNINNIKRAFAIWLKTKKRLIDGLYGGYIAEFNPLWNVDGVVGEIRETNHTGTNVNDKSGDDSTTKSGNEEFEKFGKESTTRNGSMSKEFQGAEIDVKSTMTFDDQQTWRLSEKNEKGYSTEQGHERKETDTYTNLKDDLEFTNRKDKTTYNNVKDKIEYNSTNTETRNLKDTDLFMQIRQGNIGVVSSVSLLTENQELYMSELMDLWKWIVRMCVNQVSYTIEGVL